jgi:hypothetical protein
MKFSLELPKLPLPDVNQLKAELVKVAQEEMLVTRNRIVTDTTQGHKDADGGALRRYSGKYLKAIGEGRVFGYDGTKKTSTQTDLKITGLLMRSQQVKPTPDGAENAFVGQHPVKNSGRGEFDTRDRSNRDGSVSTDRKTGGGKFGLGGRLAERQKRRSGSISNSQLAGILYALGFAGWFQFGKKDVERITKRMADAAAKRFFSR